MSSNMENILRNCGIFFLWAFAYYLIAIASRTFDDPQSQKAIIWFPAGVAVAAFLSLRRTRWPALLVALVIAKILLDNHSHGAWRVVLSAAFEISGALVIAGLVRHLTRRGDELHEIIVWIMTTIIVSAIWVLLRKVGAELMEDDFPHNTFWEIWISLINGIFFATVIVMGVVSPYSADAPLQARRALFSGIWLLLLGLVTWYIFSGPPRWLVSFEDSDAGTAIYFMLTCLPLVLTIIVTVVGGRRMSSLALLVVGVTVVSYTDQRIGPFYLDRLLRGEPLVLAKSYLSIIALLVAVIRASTRAPQPDPQNTSMSSVAYQLNLTSGHLSWDDYAQLRLGVSMHVLSSKQEIMQRVHPDDLDQLKDHWYRDGPMGQTVCLLLRIRQDNGSWLSIQDMSLGTVRSTEERVRVGVWCVR